MVMAGSIKVDPGIVIHTNHSFILKFSVTTYLTFVLVP